MVVVNNVLFIDQILFVAEMRVIVAELSSFVAQSALFVAELCLFVIILNIHVLKSKKKPLICWNQGLNCINCLNKRVCLG
ncbi:hypothetical protein, partial [Viridibacillus soli]|uniref:hypothetical protein n=1 Tax=Viridibacillus soli TaxID=2798301 RepID=UPI001F2F22F4